MKKHKITKISKSRGDALDKIDSVKGVAKEASKLTILSALSGMLSGACLMLNDPDMNTTSAIICAVSAVVFLGAHGVLISDKHKIRKLKREIKDYDDEERDRLVIDSYMDKY